MNPKTKTVLEILTILGLIIGSYFIGKNSGTSQAPVKMQIVVPAVDTTKGTNV